MSSEQPTPRTLFMAQDEYGKVTATSDTLSGLMAKITSPEARVDFARARGIAFPNDGGAAIQQYAARLCDDMKAFLAAQPRNNSPAAQA